MAAGRPLLVTRYRRIKGSPADATQALLDELFAVFPRERVTGVRVTGSGGRLIGEALGAAYENEFKAIARGLAALHPEVATVFEMGGETSKFIRLDTDCALGRVGISDYSTNGDCAAGTGSFMDQQASRLLYDIEDVGEIVCGAGKAASIAGRCSVFAKSDMIHAQQKGYEPPEVLRGLCDAVIRNFRGTITKGKVIQPPVAFIGGVAANEGAVQAVREAFGFIGRRPVRASAVRLDGRRRRRPHPGRRRRHAGGGGRAHERAAAGRVPHHGAALHGRGPPAARHGRAVPDAGRGRRRRRTWAST